MLLKQYSLPLYAGAAASELNKLIRKSYTGMCRTQVHKETSGTFARKTGAVLETVLEHLELVFENRMLHKLLNIIERSSNALHNLLIRQLNTYNERLPQLHCDKEVHSCSILANIHYSVQLQLRSTVWEGGLI